MAHYNYIPTKIILGIFIIIFFLFYLNETLLFLEDATTSVYLYYPRFKNIEVVEHSTFLLFTVSSFDFMLL